ncbi:MAG: acetyl-CoA hydrolase/transferase family protein [Firmicutes bacterium]|nr:acetyl-CoA hydrolase/transferase family protein [Bacillota bacterium]
MDIKRIYKSKVINVEKVLEKINSHDNIVSALAAAEPKEILSKLHTIAKNVENVNVTTCLPMGSYDYFENPKYKNSFFMDGWFYSPTIRKAHKNGNVSFIPNHLHLSGTKRLFHRKPNVFIGTAAPMDKHGNVSLSLSATYERTMIENADLVIIEINPNMPRTFGDTIIHINDIDYIVEADYKVPELTVVEPTQKDRIIGKNIAKLVEDGSTIQLGIGGIPNAVTRELMDKKDLGIHTEMMTDGMVDLYNAGVITGKKKTLMPGKMVATFALGTNKLYDFIDDNPAVMIMNGNWVNDPYIIGKNKKMVSINTTLQIDLTGQCASESIGHKQFSGTGGQADTAIGAQNSPEGKSIIALYSTAKIRVAGSDERKVISKIVPRLDYGAAVTLSRNDVDYVVTEYGIASLRGTSVKERVKRLISIAHPDFRDNLENEAKELMIW